nr:MAG TPA: hypothetical protein [Ackermannviridae sp. ctjwt21]
MRRWCKSSRRHNAAGAHGLKAHRPEKPGQKGDQA